MNDLTLYIHGRGGSAEERAHYAPLFPGCEVVGLDYRADTPWGAGEEIRGAVAALRGGHSGIVLIANSIGAYFSMCAGIDGLIRRAYFISPVVDMEKLIRGIMARAGVDEDTLKARSEIATPFGEVLSWDYLRYVRAHPIRWSAPTEILYGSRDDLTDRQTIEAFAARHGARLTVLEGGEHWFHTEAQMRFLDGWIKDSGGTGR